MKIKILIKWDKVTKDMKKGKSNLVSKNRSDWTSHDLAAYCGASQEYIPEIPSTLENFTLDIDQTCMRTLKWTSLMFIAFMFDWICYQNTSSNKSLHLHTRMGKTLHTQIYSKKSNQELCTAVVYWMSNVKVIRARLHNEFAGAASPEASSEVSKFV